MQASARHQQKQPRIADADWDLWTKQQDKHSRNVHVTVCVASFSSNGPHEEQVA